MFTFILSTINILKDHGKTNSFEIVTYHVTQSFIFTETPNIGAKI